jgi:hypothetical protein
MQTSYTKVSTKMSDAIGNMIGADLSNPFSKRPTIIATKVSSLEAVPKQLRTKIGSKEFIETKSKPGVAYADLYKAEYQAILASGQEIKVTNKQYYTQVGGFGKNKFLGKRIPITEQEVTGKFIKQNTPTKSKPTKSSPYSYDVTKSTPLINTAYILWTPPKTSKTKLQTSKYKKPYTGYPTSKTVSAKTLDYAPSGAYSKQTSTSKITPITSTFKTTSSTPKYKSTSTYSPTKSTSKITPITSTFKTTSTTRTPTSTTRTPTSTTRTPTPPPRTPNTSTYTPPKFVPPKYIPPKYKDKQTKQKPPKPVKYKPASLYEYKERTKSRSIQSILGVRLAKTPKIKVGRKKR